MGTSSNLINGGWRFGTFATLLACSILLSFLIYLYQGSSLSPFELIKSIRTKAMTTPTQTPAPAPTPTPTTSQAPAPILTPAVAPVAATMLMPTMASISAAPTPTPTPTVTITSPETLANISIDIVIGKPKSVANTSSLLLDDATYDKLLMNESKVKECNIFDGKWVYDPKKSPLYKNRLCPFLSDQVSCRRNGRPEFEYEKWRWEAKDCQIPKWNGKEILERLRGKRVIIAGDSLNRNQWESLSCLLYSAISPRRAYVRSGSRPKIFKAKDYNCTVEFFWSPFLVQFDETKRVGHRVLNIDKLSPFAKQWRGADVMIFNTGYWWTRKIQRWDLYQHKGKLVKDVKPETAFQIAMKTWANWVDLNVDPAKTIVVFRSISAIHKEEQWCFNQTQPINDDSYITPFKRSLIEIILKTIKQMRTPTKYLNITKLSEYRKDAHPTIYTTTRGKLLTIEQRREPELYADCNHWCLPGVPDTWNSLLFTSLFLDSYPNQL